MLQDEKTCEAPPTTSSTPAEVPEKQAALFREVLYLLEDRHVPLAVSGAFALRHHTGICRYTKDLDLFMTASCVPPSLAILTEHGFRCEVRDPVWLAKAYKDEFFVDLITGMSNGVMAVENSWLERAVPAVVYGVKTRVLAPEELVASRLFIARRERFDGADIAHIIFGTYKAFDWQRCLQLAAENWEMLLWSLVLFRYVYPAYGDYVPKAVWNDLLSRFTDALERDEPNAPFRGSLVDENMFAIDVNEWAMDDLLATSRTRRLAEIANQIAKTNGCGNGQPAKRVDPDLNETSLVNL